MADDNTYNVSMSFSATNDSVIAALQQIGDSLKSVGDSADNTGEKLKGMGPKTKEGSEISVAALAKMAVGFATIEGAAEKSFEILKEGFTKLINVIPQATENTYSLARSLEGLHTITRESYEKLDLLRKVVNQVGLSEEQYQGWIQMGTRMMAAHAKQMVANKVATDEAALSTMTFEDRLHRFLELFHLDPNQQHGLEVLTQELGRGAVQQLPNIERFDRAYQAMKNTVITTNAVISQETTEAAADHVAAIGRIKDKTQEVEAAIEKFTRAETEGTERMKLGWVELQQVLETGHGSLKQALADLTDQDSWYMKISNTISAAYIPEMGYAMDALNKYLVGNTKVQEQALILSQKLKSSNEELEASLKDAGRTKTRTLQEQAGIDKKREEAQKESEKAKRRDEEAANERQKITLELLKDEDKSQQAITLDEKEQAEVLKVQDNLISRIAEINKARDQDKYKGHEDEETAARLQAARNEETQLAAIHDKYNEERKNAAQKLNDELAAIEGVGVDRMVAQIHARFGKMREDARKNSADQIAIDRITADEQITISAAMTARVTGDMKKLEEGLKALAKEKGHALSMDEEITEVNRLGISMNLSADSIKKMQDQIRQTESLKAGWNAAMGEMANKTGTSFTTMKDAALSVSHDFESGFSNIITSGNKLDVSIKNMATSIIKSLADIGAKWAVGKLAGLAFFNETDAASKKSTAAQVSGNAAAATSAATSAVEITASEGGKVVAYDASAVSAQETAAAEIWAEFATMPGLASEIIAMMESDLTANALSAKTIVANATGGFYDHPTIGLLGEAGADVVMPETNFREYFESTLQAGARLGSQISGPSSSGTGSQPSVQINQNFHGPVYDPSQLATQAHADMTAHALTRGLQSRAWRYNVDQQWGIGG